MSENQNQQLKPKTFRIDESTAEKIRKIAETIGGNQQGAFVKLIEAYELQAGKSRLPGKKEAVEQFERYTTALVHMYLESLEAGQMMKETVYAEYDDLLKSKDTVIQDLQKRLEEADHQKKEAQAHEKEVRERARAHEEEIKERAQAREKELTEKAESAEALLISKEKEYQERCVRLQETLGDKENVIQVLQEACDSLKQKNRELKLSLEKLSGEWESLAGVRETLAAVTSECEELRKTKESLEQKLKEERTGYEKKAAEVKQKQEERLRLCQQQSELALDKAVLETERKYQKELLEIKEKSQAEIDVYQKKYMTLWEMSKK